jgi:O-antigen/teichoic acid export membrane protein
MSALSKNIAYNLLASLILLLASLVAVKSIFSVLGVDLFGIIYFSEVISALIAVAFDKSMRFTITREVSGNLQGNPDYVIRFVRSYSLFVWSFFGLIACGLYGAAPLVVGSWINLTNLEPEVAVDVFRVMSIVAISSLVLSFYRSVLDGAQHMLSTNIIDVVIAVVQRFGVVGLLAMGEGVQAVMVWYVAMTVVQLLSTGMVINKVLGIKYVIPGYYKGTVNSSVWFSRNMLLAAFYNVLQSSLDVLIISKVLSVGYVGFYSNIKHISGKASMIRSAITRAAYPSMCESWKHDERSVLISKYMKVDNLVCAASVGILAFGLFVSVPLLSYLFGEDVAWQLFLPFLFLLLGQFVNSLVAAPWIYSLAVGRPEITTRANLVSLIVFAPVTFALIVSYGIEGAGLSMFLYNIFYCVYALPLIFRECLKLPFSYWLTHTLGLAIAILFPFVLLFVVLLSLDIWTIYTAMVAYVVASGFSFVISWRMMGPELKGEVLMIYRKMIKCEL